MRKWIPMTVTSLLWALRTVYLIAVPLNNWAGTLFSLMTIIGVSRFKRAELTTVGRAGFPLWVVSPRFESRIAEEGRKPAVEQWT